MKQMDVIWNLTAVCPHSCTNCCVSAVQVRREAGHVRLWHHDDRAEESFNLSPGENIYDASSKFLQRTGRELPLAGKLKILDNLAGCDVRLDISGGDVLIVDENRHVLAEAARRLSPNNITLTATGLGLYRVDPREIAPLISELNFTYDRANAFANPHRPSAYAPANLKRAMEYSELGVSTRAECPLSRHNINLDHLTELYLDLNHASVKTLLMMRLFPVGRGSNVAEDTPSADQYRAAIAHLRRLEANFHKPRIKLQCALRFFDAPVNYITNPCDLLHLSLGLRPDGRLLLSPWALNTFGDPLSDAWVLGNLAESHVTELLASNKARALSPRLDQNFGHCKIFSFLHSAKVDEIDRMLDTTDPLLTGDGAIRAPALATK